MGEKTFSAGRAGDKSSIELENYFRDNGFDVQRLKTGTPPRIKTSSIDFENLEQQDSDNPIPMLSYLHDHYGQPFNKILKLPSPSINIIRIICLVMLSTFFTKKIPILRSV